MDQAVSKNKIGTKFVFDILKFKYIYQTISVGQVMSIELQYTLISRGHLEKIKEEYSLVDIPGLGMPKMGYIFFRTHLSLFKPFPHSY